MEKHKSTASKDLLAELVGTKEEEKVEKKQEMNASKVLEQKM